MPFELCHDDVKLLIISAVVYIHDTTNILYLISEYLK
jgi:hypothetical protein